MEIIYRWLSHHKNGNVFAISSPQTRRFGFIDLADSSCISFNMIHLRDNKSIYKLHRRMSKKELPSGDMFRNALHNMCSDKAYDIDEYHAIS